MTTPRFTLITTDTEQVLAAGPVRLFKIIAQGTTTGTITLREAKAIGGSNTVLVLSAAQALAGVDFGVHGVVFDGGLTVQLSVTTDDFIFCLAAA